MKIATLMAAAWLVSASVLAADRVGGDDVPIPGGTVAMARAIGIEPAPDRSRFLVELVRTLYDTRERHNVAIDSRLTRLRSYLDAVNLGTVLSDHATETVPVPLTAKVWSDALFHRPVAASTLFVAIVSDRRAALVAHGLAALDDQTLRYLSDHPAILSSLYENHAASFAAFGDALRIHGGRVVPPGGAEDVPMWESALDAKVTDPDQFVRVVFGASHGRLALVYAALAELDAPHVKFALGSWMPDPAARVSQFKALLAASAARTEWDITLRPFTRSIDDVALLLTRVRVQLTGAPAAPAARLFWQRAFEADDIPDDPVRLLSDPRKDGVVDAGWLAEHVCVQDVHARGERLDQLSFAQRAFAATPEAQLPEALVAVRSLPRFRMLMLTLDRMGVRDPRVYAASARQANRLMALDGRRRFVALGQFQGALALTDRLLRVHSLTAPAAEALAAGVAAVALDADGLYHGGMARWIDRALAPALQWPSDADVDTELVRSLAGVAQPAAAQPRVSWEGRMYRVDLVAPERNRLTRAREKMGSPSIGVALELEHAATKLSAPSLAVADLGAAVAALRDLGSTLPKTDRKTLVLPPGVEAPRSPAEILDRAIAELSKIAEDNDPTRVLRAAHLLSGLGDDLLAQALMSWAYALEIGDPDGTTLMGGDPSRRHDFGIDAHAEARIRAAWAEPADDTSAGAPRHIAGSLLGLDIALSALALRRIDAGDLPSPAMTTPDRDGFIKTVALINPFDLTDAGRDAIVAAIGRGRARVAGLADGRLEGRAEAGWDQAADQIRMDGWRRRAGRWALAHDAASLPALFSLTELVQLGAPAPDLPLDAWGMASLPTDGCLCLAAPSPGRASLLSGRPSLGLVATQVADVNLRVAERLGSLRLPASLARGVLAAAVQDFVDRVRPIHESDWLTLVRTAQAIPDDLIDDYVAALTADGPLVADRPTVDVVGRPKSW